VLEEVLEVLVAGAFVPVGVGILFALLNSLHPALVIFLPLFAFGFVTFAPRTLFRAVFAPFAVFAVFAILAVLAPFADLGAFLVGFFLGAGALSDPAAAALERWSAVTLRVPVLGRRRGEVGWSVR
jgi:hypothetical protein